MAQVLDLLARWRQSWWSARGDGKTPNFKVMQFAQARRKAAQTRDEQSLKCLLPKRRTLKRGQRLFAPIYRNASPFLKSIFAETLWSDQSIRRAHNEVPLLPVNKKGRFIGVGVRPWWSRTWLHSKHFTFWSTARGAWWVYSCRTTKAAPKRKNHRQ